METDVYAEIRSLMAEAENAHKDVDKQFAGKLEALLAARGMASTVKMEPPTRSSSKEFTVIPADPEAAPTHKRARSGKIRDAVREILADGKRHKLADMAHDSGLARGSIFNALARMVERGEAISHGNGVYQATQQEGSLVS